MSLLTRIANLRADYAGELDFLPSSSRPVLTYTYDEHDRVMVPDAVEASAIGMTLSARMVRVGQSSYGLDMPVQRAIKDLWSWCRRRHIYPDKTSPEPLHSTRGLICPRLVIEVICHTNGSGEHGIEEAWLPELRENYYARLIRRAAELEDLEYGEACDFLSAAFIRIDRQVTLWTAGAA